MSPFLRTTLGVTIGLAAAMVVLAVYQHGGGPADPGHGPLLSDCDGRLQHLVIHYVEEAADTVVPTYRDFLTQLPADVTVSVVCPRQKAFDDLLARIGPTACRLAPVIVDHAMTTWSRDRWLALGPSPGGRMLLLAPRGEDAAGVWPARAGDQRIAADLAAALGPGVAARTSDLYFDGGDFMADGETAFVRPAVLLRNLQHTVATREELVARLEDLLRRRVILFDEAPDHHVGMYLMPVGDRTVLVADPRLGEPLFRGAGCQPAAHSLGRQLHCRPVAEAPRGGSTTAAPTSDGVAADFSAATVARFDAVAEQCRAAGYRVVRIPVVPGEDGRTFLTFVNAILDQRDGCRIVYMPTFAGADALNRAAAAVWRELGYEVRPVSCDACYRHFGTLHCLVNVLRRG